MSLFPKKSCPSCMQYMHSARKACDCGYLFKQESGMRDEQVIVQECFPPNYVYLGGHAFANVEMSGTPVKIHVAKLPSGDVIQRQDIRTLTTAVWNDALRPSRNRKKKETV